MGTRMRICMITAGLTLLYTLIAGALILWARHTGLPTHGGISPSEILEGYVPGGLATLLAVEAVLIAMTIGTSAWALGRPRP